MKFDKLIKQALRGLDKQMGSSLTHRRSSGHGGSKVGRTGNPPTGNRRGPRKGKVA